MQCYFRWTVLVITRVGPVMLKGHRHGLKSLYQGSNHGPPYYRHILLLFELPWGPEKKENILIMPKEGNKNTFTLNLKVGNLNKEIKNYIKKTQWKIKYWNLIVLQLINMNYKVKWFSKKETKLFLFS